MGENGRGTITTNLWFCGWRASERRTNAKKGGGWREKTKKKEREIVEREKGVKTSFLLVPRNIWAKVYILCLKYTLVIYYNSNSLATTRTHTHTFATNISLSTAENQHYYHRYHHRSIEEHEGGSDVFFPKHTLMCPPCSNILKNTAWKPKECAASTPLTLSW